MSPNRIRIWIGTAIVTMTLAAVSASAQAPTPPKAATATKVATPPTKAATPATKAAAPAKATTGGAGLSFTGTTVNVAGARDSIRINLMNWSTDADRARTTTAWTQAQARAAALAAAGKNGDAAAAAAAEGKIQVVLPGQGQRSPIIAKLTDTTGKQMPPTGPLSSADIAIVFGWIENGAKPDAFAKDVQPIFNKNCVSCHSGNNARAGLHLDTLEGVFKGGDDLEAAAAAKVAGDPEEGGAPGKGAALTPEGSLATALEKAPTLGYVWAASEVAGYAVHYAVQLPEKDGSERVILITDRRLGAENDRWQPVTSSAPSSAAKKPTDAAKYDFSVIELHLGANGQGEGKISLDNKLAVDNVAKTITLADYKELPVILKDVDRKGTKQ